MAQAPSYQSRGMSRIAELPEGVTQSFKIGDYLTLDGSGRVVQGLTGGSNLGASSAGTTTNRVVGRALQNASGNTTGKLVSVLIAEPHTEFLLPIYHGTPSSAVPNTNLVGKTFELRYVSGSPSYFRCRYFCDDKSESARYRHVHSRSLGLRPKRSRLPHCRIDDAVWAGLVHVHRRADRA